MIVGKVIGSVVSTRKNDALIGNKFMIVEPLESMLYGKSRIIATDNIGAVSISFAKFASSCL